MTATKADLVAAKLDRTVAIILAVVSSITLLLLIFGWIDFLTWIAAGDPRCIPMSDGTCHSSRPYSGFAAGLSVLTIIQLIFSICSALWLYDAVHQVLKTNAAP